MPHGMRWLLHWLLPWLLHCLLGGLLGWLCVLLRLLWLLRLLELLSQTVASLRVPHGSPPAHIFRGVRRALVPGDAAVESWATSARVRLC